MDIDRIVNDRIVIDRIVNDRIVNDRIVNDHIVNVVNLEVYVQKPEPVRNNKNI